MTIHSSAWAGARATEALDVTVTSATLNLTTVSAVSLAVVNRDTRAAATWAATIVSATATSLLMRHPFSAQESVAGSFEITPLLTVPGVTDPYRGERFIHQFKE